MQPRVERLIQKATAKNPEQRYGDVLAFAADFRGVVGLTFIPEQMLVELLTPREQEILAADYRWTVEQARLRSAFSSR